MATSITLTTNAASTEYTLASGWRGPAGATGTSLTAGTGIDITEGVVSSTVTGNATHTGDATGSTALTLATVNGNIGSFTNASITVNAKGLVTAASHGTTAITTITGTANQITVSGGFASKTLSLPATITGLTSVTSTTFVGALTGNATTSTSTTGNAATVTTNANLTGHITSVGNAASLGSFTLAQLNTAVSDADVAPTANPIFTGTVTAAAAAFTDGGAQSGSGSFIVTTGGTGLNVGTIPTGTWAARVFNQLDQPTQNGMLVMNRWAGPDSTAFQVGSMYNGASQSFFKIDGLGGTTFSGAMTYGGVTLSNSVTGTGSMVLSASPTLTGSVTFSGQIASSGSTDATVSTNVVNVATNDARYSGPKFSAYNTASQLVPTGTYTKIAYQAEDFDTASCYNTATSRFTPNKAGYYLISIGIRCQTNANSSIFYVYKNGSAVKAILQDSNHSTVNRSASLLVYANGTTDYFEIYCWHNKGSDLTVEHTLQTNGFFSGAFIP